MGRQSVGAPMVPGPFDLSPALCYAQTPLCNIDHSAGKKKTKKATNECPIHQGWFGWFWCGANGMQSTNGSKSGCCCMSVGPILCIYIYAVSTGLFLYSGCNLPWFHFNFFGYQWNTGNQNDSIVLNSQSLQRGIGANMTRSVVHKTIKDNDIIIHSFMMSSHWHCTTQPLSAFTHHIVCFHTRTYRDFWGWLYQEHTSTHHHQFT